MNICKLPCLPAGELRTRLRYNCARFTLAGNYQPDFPRTYCNLQEMK